MPCVFLVPSFRPEYIIFVEMDTLKTLQRLEAATEKCSGKYMLLKCRNILKDYKSECNPLKMLKRIIW